MFPVYVGTGFCIWNTIFWELNDAGSKKACRITVKKELRKKVETCETVCVRTG